MNRFGTNLNSICKINFQKVFFKKNGVQNSGQDGGQNGSSTFLLAISEPFMIQFGSNLKCMRKIWYQFFLKNSIQNGSQDCSQNGDS